MRIAETSCVGAVDMGAEKSHINIEKQKCIENRMTLALTVKKCIYNKIIKYSILYAIFIRAGIDIRRLNLTLTSEVDLRFVGVKYF